jgi:uncharacterized membrane-anchored protein YjiN (DUF445 family)
MNSKKILENGNFVINSNPETTRMFSPKIEARRSDITLPSIGSTSKPIKKINYDLNNIFDMANQLKEDPEIKNKIDSLLQNIVDIKNVLKQKNIIRNKISSAPSQMKSDREEKTQSRERLFNYTKCGQNIIESKKINLNNFNSEINGSRSKSRLVSVKSANPSTQGKIFKTKIVNDKSSKNDPIRVKL